MDTPRFSTPVAERQRLEESWRSRLEQTRRRYDAARHVHRRILAKSAKANSLGLEGALARATQEEADALDQYARVLQIFTDLTVHDKRPNEGAASANDRH